MATKNKSYTIRIEKNILQERVTPKTIVIYSPDKDFSESLSMVLQDFFNVVTTNDVETLRKYATIHNADIVIADAMPTEDIRQCFEAMKKERRHLHIIMLYVSRLTDKRLKDEFRKIVDAFFYKPIELTELIDSINAVL